MPEMSSEPTSFEPQLLATTIGSLPHADVSQATSLMLQSTPEIPSWVQFPKRSPRENMMFQFTGAMPALVEEEDRVYFDTTSLDFTDQLTGFYARYLDALEEKDPEALDSFEITPDYAAGIDELIQQLPAHMETHEVVLLKGQVTGPFTLGTNLLDQERRCSYYDPQLRDVVVKTIALKAVWQIAQLEGFGHRVMIFLDEPALLGFGSQTFITVSREDVIQDLNEVASAIHAHGGLAGIHCEENTDWSLLMEADLDVLDFDAYDHMQAITLYPSELRRFLDRGGSLGWGIVPTLSREAAAAETVQSLERRFEAGVARLASKGFDREMLLRCALITPSCGMGGVLSEPLAERVLEVLRGLSETLRRRHGFV